LLKERWEKSAIGTELGVAWRERIDTEEGGLAINGGKREFKHK